MKFTVFGGTGFIGSRLLRRLRLQGHECFAPSRAEIPTGKNLGHVFYCIGLTSDFRQRLAETIDAHVCHFMDLLRKCQYERICYLSSTRVYKGLDLGEETQALLTQPATVSDIYDLSKLMGEAACLHVGTGGVVARLSNVFSMDDPSDNFLSSVQREAQSIGRLHLHTALTSAKDYVLLEDVLDMLPKILVEGREDLYNVASGRNVTHAEVVEALGCPVDVSAEAPETLFPPISIVRLQQEFGYTPRDVLSVIASSCASKQELE